MTISLRRLEIAVSVALLVLGVFAIWEAARMPFGTPGLPGPAMVPMALGVLIAVSSAGLIVWRLKVRPPEDDVIAIGHRRITLAVTAILAAGLLFERAGFLVTSTLLLFVLLWSLSPLGWWRSLIAAGAASVAARYLFQNLLNVPLPPLPFF